MISVFATAAVLLIAGCKKKEDSPTPAASPTTPSVTAKSPAANATNVSLSKVISVTFSEAMDASTINSTSFTLKQGTLNVSGTVAYQGTTATFAPTSPLTAGTTYTVFITTDMKSAAGVAIAANTSWTFSTGSNAIGLAAVNLGTAGNYVILAKTAINNSPTSNITGNLGLSPAATSYITGFSITNATGYATSAQVTGKLYAADMVSPTSINLTTAVNDMVTAYNNAAGRPSPDFSELGTGNIGGKTLTEGLYKWTTNVTAPTNLIISGSSTDVWIFQIAGNLSVSSGVKITLSGGAQAKNIFWQVAGTATIGTTAQFKGVILSQTGITLNTGALLTGRALAQTAVILNKNTVTQP
ncbi:MAG: large protein [Bacteroidetes bacterium]|nr:large protein [Bacteroidota bacterium]MDF2452826.1 large protein [Bacteroidota bacterium]